MKIVNVRKWESSINNQLIYALKFNNDDRTVIRYFDEFAGLIGKLQVKQFNIDTNEWLVDNNGYEAFDNLDKRLFPKNNFAPAENIVVDNIPQKIVTGYESIGVGLKLPLYEYQKQIVKFAIDNVNSLIVSPCGSGKSPCALAVYLEAIDRKIISGRGLIVVKASLKTQWLMEVKKFTNLRAGIIQTYAAFKGANAYNDFNAQFDNIDLMILNYETLRDAKVKSTIHKIKPQFVYADEIHLIKNAHSKRAQALCEFADAKMRIGATATPIQKDPRDIFGLFRFINPDLFPSGKQFDSTYVRFVGRGIVGGVKNESLLKSKIAPFMIVKTKDEVAKQLPKLLVIQRYCDLAPAQIEITETLKVEIDEFSRQRLKLEKTLSDKELHSNPEYQKLETAILSRQTFAQEIADSEQLLEISDSNLAKQYISKSRTNNKLDLLMDLIEEVVSSGEKITVFSRFARMQEVIINKIHEAAKNNSIFKFNIATVNGGMSDKARYAEVYTKFQNDDSYKLLIMSDSGAEGLNLSKCKYLCEYEPAISYAIQTQRHGRIERADSLFDNVIVYQLIANRSWDEIAQKIVAKKEHYDTTLVQN